ncbi:14542_t:CDS:2 [Dentiscutata erythropus]|uniref:Peroxisomal membrane protein PEX14 n=1 Tax=Dentiscutata erythropus TaxID=1348616 RepID=A0A9N9AYT0_9GLOM|nr:14542_t:CDS:2 [Dentiscutata erythropus]
MEEFSNGDSEVNDSTITNSSVDNAPNDTNVDNVQPAVKAEEELPTTAESEAMTSEAPKANIEPREILLSHAVKFLSDSSILEADDEKKIQFLLGKGLTRKEIDIAKERATRMLPTPIPPAVPPRTYAQPMPVSRTPLWKQLAFVLLITGTFSAFMIAVIKKFLGPMVTSIIFAKQQLYSHQLSLFRKFNEALLSFVSLLRTPRVPPHDDSDSDEELPTPTDQDEISTPPSLLAPLSTDLTTLSERLNTYQQNLEKNNDLSDLKLSVNTLTAYLTENTYPYKNWTNSERGDSAVAKIKEEIRGLKGLLINRRNFPKIPATPTTYSSTSKPPTEPQIQEIE